MDAPSSHTDIKSEDIKNESNGSGNTDIKSESNGNTGNTNNTNNSDLNPKPESTDPEQQVDTKSVRISFFFLYKSDFFLPYETTEPLAPRSSFFVKKNKREMEKRKHEKKVG